MQFNFYLINRKSFVKKKIYDSIDFFCFWRICKISTLQWLGITITIFQKMVKSWVN
uniref:Uncharacterized protein n=1 Tax=Kuenenia stuttgartiensis TaxID=174633 RepID=Q1Q164_KUEST|nr:unknown protein [Candidatus Kuenenia stuttgartiensis]